MSAVETTQGSPLWLDEPADRSFECVVCRRPIVDTNYSVVRTVRHRDYRINDLGWPSQWFLAHSAHDMLPDDALARWWRRTSREAVAYLIAALIALAFLAFALVTYLTP